MVLSVHTTSSPHGTIDITPIYHHAILIWGCESAPNCTSFLTSSLLVDLHAFCVIRVADMMKSSKMLMDFLPEPSIRTCCIVLCCARSDRYGSNLVDYTTKHNTAQHVRADSWSSCVILLSDTFGESLRILIILVENESRRAWRYTLSNVAFLTTMQPLPSPRPVAVCVWRTWILVC